MVHPALISAAVSFMGGRLGHQTGQIQGVSKKTTFSSTISGTKGCFLETYYMYSLLLKNL